LDIKENNYDYDILDLRAVNNNLQIVGMATDPLIIEAKNLEYSPKPSFRESIDVDLFGDFRKIKTKAEALIGNEESELSAMLDDYNSLDENLVWNLDSFDLDGPDCRSQECFIEECDATITIIEIIEIECPTEPDEEDDDSDPLPPPGADSGEVPAEGDGTSDGTGSGGGSSGGSGGGGGNVAAYNYDEECTDELAKPLVLPVSDINLQGGCTDTISYDITVPGQRIHEFCTRAADISVKITDDKYVSGNNPEGFKRFVDSYGSDPYKEYTYRFALSWVVMGEVVTGYVDDCRPLSNSPPPQIVNV